MSQSSVFSPATLLYSEMSQQIHGFFHHLDRREYEEMLDLCGDEMRWLRQGEWLEGKDAMRTALERRPMHTDTRHVMTNMWVTEVTADSALVEAYMTAYRYAASQSAPPHINGAFRFNQVSTVFKRCSERGWQIVEQRMVPVLSFFE